MPEVLIQKHFEPDEAPEYKAALTPLSHPDDYALLASEAERVVEWRNLTDSEALQVARRPHIKRVEPDYTARSPEPVDVAAAEQLSTAEILRRLGVDELHEQGLKGQEQRIAVIDTGCGEAFARSLGDRVVARGSYVPGEGWQSPDDTHGEWCLSIIAAIAPEAEYVILKGLSGRNGSGTYSGIIKCIERARELGCTQISMSLGGPASDILDSAVNAADAAGVLVAVAAGNEQRGKTILVADDTSPARASGPLTIAAAQSDLVVADFSNHGTCVDLSSLGVYVQAPDVARHWSGTSMATPEVAALCALVQGARFSKSAVKQAMLSAARDTPEPAYEEGQGFVDAVAALDKLQPETVDSEAPPLIYKVYPSRRMSHKPTAERVVRQINQRVDLPPNLTFCLLDTSKRKEQA